MKPFEEKKSIMTGRNEVKIIIVLGYFLTMMIMSLGCTPDTTVINETVDANAENGIDSISMFSEENFQELKELFKSMEEEVKGLVTVFSEDNDLMNLEKLMIAFLSEEEYRRSSFRFEGEVVINAGEVVDSRPEEFAELVESNAELMKFLRIIDEKGILWDMSFSTDSYYENTWRVSFYIRPEYVSFIGTDMQDCIRSYFLYQEGTRRFQRTREIEEGWYIHIETRD
jgi:hypothetical protein